MKSSFSKLATRSVAVLLSIIMIFSLIPFTASAATYEAGTNLRVTFLMPETKFLSGIEGSVTYGDTLRYVSNSISVPNVADATVNTSKEGVINFNATNIDAYYDMSGDYVLFTAVFKTLNDIDVLDIECTVNDAYYLDDSYQFIETSKLVEMQVEVVSTGFGDEVYFVNTYSWATVNGYVWNDGEGPAWPGSTATLVDKANGVYSYDVTNKDYLIFNNGQNNETATLDAAGNIGKYYEPLTEAFYDSLEDALAAVDAIPKYDYYVVGSESLTGKNWKLRDPDNGMTKDSDGNYTKAYIGVAAGEHSLKVSNGVWAEDGGEEYPSVDYKFTVEQDNSIVFVTLTADKQVVITVNNKVVPQPETTAPTGGNPTVKSYCLIGYINGKDVGCGNDSESVVNVFENGKITLDITQSSFVYVKTTDNKTEYMTNGYLGTNVTTATLYDKNNLADPNTGNKLYVPAGRVTFTIVEKTDGNLTLSYTVGDIPSSSDPTDKPVTTDPATKPTTPTSPTVANGSVGEGADADDANEVILNQKDDEDPKGSNFMVLSAKQKKVKKNSIQITWNKVSGVSKYVVYGAKCGSSYKKIKTLRKVKFTQKKLQKGTYYKYLVMAIDSDNKVVSTSKTLHIATLGSKKKANPTGITTAAKNDQVSIKVKKKFKLKAVATKAKNTTVKNHRKVKYESSMPTIATVTKKGVIKGKKAGTCYVYAYAQNGLYKKVKVTVK